MTADALSDVLRTVRLTGATFFDVVASVPWVAELPPRELILSEDLILDCRVPSIEKILNINN